MTRRGSIFKYVRTMATPEGSLQSFHIQVRFPMTIFDNLEPGTLNQLNNDQSKQMWNG